MENISRRSLLIGLSSLALAESLAPVLSAATTEHIAFVGVYTDKGSKSKGIYAYSWDAATGELSPLGLAAATRNPSFLAISRDRSYLYAANEIDDYQGAKDGAVSAFLVDRSSGKLNLLNVVSSGGAGPCNLNLDASDKCVAVADYDGGSAATFRVLEGGKLSPAVQDIHYSGKGPNADRQTAPHAHCATFTPDNKHLLINDLGLDCIHVYKLDAATAKLMPNVPPAYKAIPDSGPRSFVFHPNGRIAYSTNELSNTVDVLDWDPVKGTLTRIQHIPSAAHPEDTKNTIASVVIDRAGKFLYVSNRGPEDSLVAYSIDPSGKLTFLQRIASGGNVPRHFALDPSEHWLVVAHQISNSLVVFKRDPDTGKLTETGRKYDIDFPTCVLFS
jgi:6-phosphogluconolactonase